MQLPASCIAGLIPRYKYTASVKEHDHFWNVVVAIGRLETYVVIGQRVHEDSLGYSRKKTGRCVRNAGNGKGNDLRVL